MFRFATRYFLILGSLTAAVCVAPWCHAATVDVVVRNNFFSPTDIVIAQGDTVRWTWVQTVGVRHTVTSGLTSSVSDNPGELFDFDGRGQGTTFSFVFDNAGEFPYFCRPHEQIDMKGTVTVEVQTGEGGGEGASEGVGEGTGEGEGSGNLWEFVFERDLDGTVGFFDTSIFEESDNAGGGTDGIFSGTTGLNQGVSLRRALLKIDLSTIPPGSTIQSVMLELAVNRSSPLAGAMEFTLHRLLRDWGEGSADAGSTGGQGVAASDGDATWVSNFHNVETWDVAGGDFEEAASAVATVGVAGTIASWTDTGLATDVQNWIDDALPNFGWILISSTEGVIQQAKRFNSSEASVDRPRLTVLATMSEDSVEGEGEGQTEGENNVEGEGEGQADDEVNVEGEGEGQVEGEGSPVEGEGSGIACAGTLNDLGGPLRQRGLSDTIPLVVVALLLALGKRNGNSRRRRRPYSYVNGGR